MSKIISLWGLLFYLTGYAQNIVPNYSFELYDTCPYAYAQIHFASPWFQHNLCCGPGGSTEYYNSCNGNAIGPNTPKNGTGFQVPKTGNAYAGIGVYSGNPSGTYGREYIEVQLNDSLVFGKKYCVSFYVSLANNSVYAIDKLGVYFSNSPITNNDNNWTNLPVIPQVENPDGNIIQDTLNWISISGAFVAGGGKIHYNWKF